MCPIFNCIILVDFGGHIGFMLISDTHSYMSYSLSFRYLLKHWYRNQNYASKWFSSKVITVCETYATWPLNYPNLNNWLDYAHFTAFVYKFEYKF